MSTLFYIFLILGGLGFTFLMVSVIIGDIFEALDLDFGTDVDFDTDVDVDVDFDLDADFDGGGGTEIGVLDSRVISMFLTAFGFVGAYAVFIGFGGVIATLIGLGTGTFFGALVLAFGYFLLSQEASSSVTERDLIGRTAKVVVGIKPNSIGQISCKIGEERVEKIARTRNGKEIKEGETVFIEEVAGNSFIVSSMEGMNYELPPK